MIRRILALPAGRFATAVLLVIASLALCGPLLAPYDPLLGTSEVLAGPSAAHWLGPAYLGRDVLSRIRAGA
ncbi:ABC transporter permease, partial [Microbacterium sp. ISL-103]|nr:ABC transporter permease [Microbacterium sp. ISL-103]